MVAMWQELREKAADADDEQLRRVWDDAGCAACRDPATRELCGSGTVPVDAADRIRFSILSMHASRFPIGRPAGRPGFSHMCRCLSCHVSESRQEMLREWRSGFFPPGGGNTVACARKSSPFRFPFSRLQDPRCRMMQDARCRMEARRQGARCRMQEWLEETQKKGALRAPAPAPASRDAACRGTLHLACILHLAVGKSENRHSVLGPDPPTRRPPPPSVGRSFVYAFVYKRVCLQSVCLQTIRAVFVYKLFVYKRFVYKPDGRCLFTNELVYKRVCLQTCLFTNEFVYKRVCLRSLFTNSWCAAQQPSNTDTGDRTCQVGVYKCVC